jgi:hypothetical protein
LRHRRHGRSSSFGGREEEEDKEHYSLQWSAAAATGFRHVCCVGVWLCSLVLDGASSVWHNSSN